MSVFSNYDNKEAGGVISQAFPNQHVQAWIPTQQNVRANPNIPSQPQRIQPQERGNYFPSSASGGGTLAPQMSSGGCGCGGPCNGSGTVDAPKTPSQIATAHSFHGTSGKVQTAAPRLQPRAVGAIRPGLPRSQANRSMSGAIFRQGLR